jgi:two-component sensor histidine kinase
MSEFAGLPVLDQVVGIPESMSVASIFPETSDTRLREAHHRIANNLALIAGFVRLQTSKVAKAGEPLSATEARLLLEEVGVRIQTVGRLHHLLGANAGAARVDLGEYLRSVCGVLSESVCVHRSIALVCDASACDVPPEGAALLGLIVAELVTNSVKYAHPSGVPGRIAVRCRRTSDDTLILTVADDGVGLPDGFDARVSGGLGMRVVRSLADQLDAVLDFDSTPLGLTVTVTAPDPTSGRSHRR